MKSIFNQCIDWGNGGMVACLFEKKEFPQYWDWKKNTVLLQRENMANNAFFDVNIFLVDGVFCLNGVNQLLRGLGKEDHERFFEAFFEEGAKENI